MERISGEEARARVLRYAEDSYGVLPDYPWITEPDYAVLRHPDGGRKWFAVIMLLPASRLGIRGDAPVHVMNVKCDPALIGALIDRKSYFPAYHMNKEHWLSVRLDGGAPDEEIFRLTDLSFALTSDRRVPKAGRELPKD